jgi:hypothetical protein
VPTSDLKETRCELTLFSGKIVFQGNATKNWEQDLPKVTVETVKDWLYSKL